jgi:hypothetical protein
MDEKGWIHIALAGLAGHFSLQFFGDSERRLVFLHLQLVLETTQEVDSDGSSNPAPKMTVWRAHDGHDGRMIRGGPQ